MRNRNFVIRLRYSEEVFLDVLKDEAEMTRSEYIRCLILTAPSYERPCYASEVASELYQALNRIGIALNSVAFNCNKRRKVFSCDIQMVRENFGELRALYDEKVLGILLAQEGESN